ncbi:MAG TPA: hypothetical protein VML01_06450 [Bryobacterales bacterium]|nr:hypothetical protein [Bryobacterales bacterium]
MSGIRHSTASVLVISVLSLLIPHAGKMVVLGMSLEDAVMRSTQNPAKAIGKFPEIRTLGESKVADVTVLRLEEGVFAYKDAWGKKKLGDKKLPKR